MAKSPCEIHHLLKSMPRLWHLIGPLRSQGVGPRGIGRQVDGQEAQLLVGLGVLVVSTFKRLKGV